MAPIMPLFTRCNIGLGCPENVSVKFQAKIPHRSFIITTGKCHFWGDFGVYANYLHIPEPSQEEGVAFTSLCISTAINSR